MKFIVLDSTPLGLLTQRPRAAEADECRRWLADKMARGLTVIVPEIVDYEVRRELLRARKSAAIQRLDRFIALPAVRYIPITSSAMRLAAALWAKARQQGTPTADPHALDVDVILSAQTLELGIAAGDLVVATSNVRHLSLFVPASTWPSI